MDSVNAIAMTSEGLRELCGRGMSTTSEVYKLPVDKQERDRLSLQHTIWKLMMNSHGLYPSEAAGVVEEILKTVERPSILDVGSGSGAWSVDMARLYPSSSVLGIDLTESRPEDVPANCRFITKDATTGLDEYFEKFDIVHTRCVVGHIMDPAALFRSIGKCLKPGGILLAADGNYILCDENRTHLPVADFSPGANNDGCSYLSGWMAELGKIKMKGSVLGQVSGEDQAAIVRLDNQFEILGERDYFGPIGWDGGEVCAPNGEELSRIWHVNLTHYLQASKGLFLSTGETKETVDGWITNVIGDVPPRIKTLFKYSFFWARKI
ncbi:S-adenosyl-L-methionine-dependent methyltransferase [Schizopora paradoxa]|uniref:S-adenosyl-L-methionine-dependent methyltransferase n=1 Tax=Schizopora paradoxa TaxID=27342 RepID=A0A0H2RAC6_9AGAM|nr:S-adenosyl-L-methionine-dependent methyltransferase [Schizopora paradoxa]